MDFRNSIVRVAYRPLSDYGDALSAAASDVFPSHLRGFETFIGSEDWLVGTAGLTVADIVLYELADQVGTPGTALCLLALPFALVALSHSLHVCFPYPTHLAVSAVHTQRVKDSLPA